MKNKRQHYAYNSSIFCKFIPAWNYAIRTLSFQYREVKYREF